MEIDSDTICNQQESQLSSEKVENKSVEIDSDPICNQREGSAKVQELVLKANSWEVNAPSRLSAEKALSFAISRASDGEGPQAVLDKYFDSLLATEGSDCHILELNKAISEMENKIQNSFSTDQEDTNQNISLNDLESTQFPTEPIEAAIQTTYSEPSVQISEDQNDTDEVITIRMKRKRKAGVTEPSMLTELNQITHEDPDRMFLLSMMPVLKKVRPDKVDDVKFKIFRVIKRNKCPSTLRNPTGTRISLMSRNSTQSERSISNADGEPAIPDQYSLINSASVSSDSLAENVSNS